METTINDNTITITARNEKEAQILKALIEWQFSNFSPEAFKNLSINDLLTLANWGHSLDELKQMETSYKITVYKHNGKKISARKARELLGDTVFLSGLSRISFHWSSSRETNGNTVSFDSSKLFK